MNAQTKTIITNLPPIGTPMEGGFLTGTVMKDGIPHALITGPKSDEFKARMNDFEDDKTKFRSLVDGRANTEQMAAAGSAACKKILELTTGGYNDWAFPARDQQEQQYRVFKPGQSKNWCSWRDGENPATGGTLYTEDSPAQTDIEAFKAGGEQAFEEAWYWNSTRYSAYSACCQYFSSGHQTFDIVVNELRVRPVRMVPLVY